MNKKLKVIIVLIFFVLMIGIVTLGFINKFSEENYNNSGENEILQQYDNLSELDISDVELDESTLKTLKNYNEEDLDNNIIKYKKVIKEFKPTKEYINLINDAINNSYDLSNIFACYNYLYDNYEQITSLNELLEKEKKGSNLGEIFKKYNKGNFIPTDFETGFLENNLRSGELSTDDIMIADIISQKNPGDIQTLLDRKKSGESWSDIKSSLKIVNLDENFKSVSINSYEVEDYMGKIDMSKEDVISALVIAKKSNVKKEDVLKAIKSKKSKEEVYADIYLSKYID